MTRVLPPNPSLEFDRKQAKALLAALRAGEAQAVERLRAHHPRFQSAPDVQELAASLDLHDAQLVVAREYGLQSWRALAEKIHAIELERFRAAVKRGDVEETRRLLNGSAELREKVNEPMFDFGGRAIHAASSNPALIDVLLEFGADINLRSNWENGPFSVLDYCPEDAARHYLARGARLTAHAASRLGWIKELRQMIDADPQVVHEKGGDGQRPLHFAKTAEIVDLLLDRGAEIDARCLDHHSTAAQYALLERPEVCRRLLHRGAMPDIFMAARLGDDELATRLIDQDPSCLGARVNAPGYAPVPPFTIYCWSLGWHLSPHEVALKFDHRSTYELLLSRSDAKVRLLVACSRADEPVAQSLVRENPGLIEQLNPQDHALLPFSMFHGQPQAVKLMLALGFDPMAKGPERATLLHAACWVGNAQIVSILLGEYRQGIDLNLRDPTHGGTPLGWAVHGSEHCHHGTGDYGAIVEKLIGAGSKLPDRISGGSDAVKEVLRRHGVPDPGEERG